MHIHFYEQTRIQGSASNQEIPPWGFSLCHGPMTSLSHFPVGPRGDDFSQV